MFANLDTVVSELKGISGGKVLLTFHSMGDTDAVSSAIALSSLFPNCVVSTPDALTSNVLRILSKLGFEGRVQRGDFPDDATAVVLLDVNNLEGCGKFRERLEHFNGKIVVIDHHMPFENLANGCIFSDEGYNSSASIVYEILGAFGKAPDPQMAKLIAMGEISDSAEFKNATAKTFTQLGELFRIGKTDYITLLTEMEHISPASERIKTMTDILSSNASVVGDLLVMRGMAHAYANLAADTAIKAGADLALFYSIGRQEVSFSARLRPTLDRKYGIHLGAVMKELSPIISGTGGGHPCAAGAYGSGIERYEEFLERFMEKLSQKVSGR